MKPLRNMLAALLIGSAALTVMPALPGCYATEGALVVEGTLPPPRAEVVVSRPGFVWVHGRWQYTGDHWLWRPGHYERERSNQVYVEGRWERRGRGHVWIEGGWRSRNPVVIRDRG